jgi:hypothetical protein
MHAIQQEAVNTGYLEQTLLAKEKNEQCTCTTSVPSSQCGVSEFEAEVRYGLAFLFIFVVLVTVFWIEEKREAKRKNGLL